MKSERLDAIQVCCTGLCVLFLLALPSAATAQGPGDTLRGYLELTTPEIRAKTMEIISGSMNFTEEEGKAFWPLYRKYEDESGAITDRMIAVIKDYQANVKTLSDAKAKELSGKVFEVDEQKFRLNKRYFKEFSRVLPRPECCSFSSSPVASIRF